MSTVFPTYFRDRLFQSLSAADGQVSIMNPGTVRAYLFSSSPSFSDNDSRYTGIQTLADLTAKFGWSQQISPAAVDMPLGTRTIIQPGETVGSTYVIMSNPLDLPAGFPDSNVTSMVLVYVGTPPGGAVVNPVILITDDPFGGTSRVIRNEDGIIALPDTTVGTTSNQVLMAWGMRTASSTQVSPTIGSLAVRKAPPDYESSHLQHVWLYPQRVNVIANPSFEVDTSHWRARGTLTQVPGGSPGGGFWRGSVAGSTPIVLESNQFPLNLAKLPTSLWTIQGMFRGTGKMRIGLLGWTDEIDSTVADWGPAEEIWTLDPNSYLHLYVCRRRQGEIITGQLRIEVDGTALSVDNLLVEPDWLRDWPYFDGDSTYGARDDYSWYGGEANKHKTYSLWYNNRSAVAGRLFAWSVPDDDFVVTDEEVEAQGFVYKWVPAGVRVTPHFDVLWPDDIRELPAPVTGDVLPYKTGPNDAMGVPNAWAATQYLTPTLGTVTTPDPGPLPNQCTFVFKVRAAGATTDQTIVGQMEGGTNGFAWNVRRYFPSGQLAVGVYPNGTGTGAVSRPVNAQAPTGADEHLALSYTINNGAGLSVLTSYRSTDGGATWTALGTYSPPTLVPFDASTVLRVGAFITNTAPWEGRIYFVELRTGLDPAAGTVVWRFDVTEATPPASIYDDTLDSDANADGVADGWVAYFAGTVNGASRSIVGGAQRIIGAPAAAAAYGIDVSPRVPISPNRTYQVTIEYAGVASTGTLAQLFVQCYTAGGAGTGGAVSFTLPDAATATTATTSITAPADAASLRILPRLLPTGAPGVATTLDIWRITVQTDFTYTDPRGRVWTVTNAGAIKRT